MGKIRLLQFLLTLMMAAMLCRALALAQPAIPGLYGSAGLPAVSPTALPQVRQVVQGVLPGGIIKDDANSKLEIRQDQAKAIIDWDSFNVGKEAWTHFDQQGNTDWAALNRIFDQNPSQIFGKLTADGKIFLINQNGILFGPTAQVNVHSLVASSLNISPDDFLADQLRFSAEGIPAGAVSNHGSIETDAAGSVFLLAPTVENGGTIIVPAGQIALAAGDEVELAALEAESRVFPFVYVTPGENGAVTNFQKGQLIADAGLAGLYGRVVNQDGLIRCVTAISNNGRIELHASEKVSTGTESQTITPISTDPERVHKSFKLQGGEIHVGGLDEKVLILDTPRNKTTATGRIEHYGDMAAPSGTVTMAAQERVYLETGSSVDVAGEWVERPGDSLVVSVQLNSVELKNDYGQKGGLLQGETVQVNPYDGSAIGDVSGALNFEFLTALEMATKGGTISMSAPSGDIIVKEGAKIDFSGGGIRYPDGTTLTTRLVAANGQVYDIAEAPQWVQYDSILNGYTKLYERYGIAETFEGLYYGGASPLKDYYCGHVQGDDAGSLILEARGIVLDGSIYGWATRGLFQTETTVSEEMFGDFAVQTTRGRRQPRGGRLVIGVENPVRTGVQEPDFLAEEVVIASQAPTLPDDFGPNDSLKAVQVNNERPYVSNYTDLAGPLYRTVLSAEKLNAAGLSDLSINVNTKVIIQDDVTLALYPGGLRVDESIEYLAGMPLQYLQPKAPASLAVKAQAVEHRGRIDVPSGDVFLMLRDTIATPNVNNPDEREVQLNQRVYLAGGSRISVAGEKIDNTLAGPLTDLYQGHIDGGDIQITDNTGSGADTILAPGAVLDVSSGYVLEPDGEISAGSAGTLQLEGSTLVVGGDLRGYSLPDHPGGHISLHADAVTVQKGAPALPPDFGFDSEVPEGLQGGLVLGDDQLDGTGFTHITLMSFRDLTVQDGVTLSPSYVKMTIPSQGLGSGVLSPAENLNLAGPGPGEGGGLITVPPDYVGSSSISAKAGQPLTGTQSVDEFLDTYGVTVSAGASLEVAPGGAIELSGLVLDLAGSLKAPAGDVKLTARGVSRDLTIRSTASILTAGCTIPERSPMAQGLAVGYDVLDGGTVSLAAKEGNINVASGAVIDVSGSRPVETFTRDSNNGVFTTTIAGAAGNLELTYFGDLTLDGELNGRVYMPNVHGASLSITRQNELSGLTINAGAVQGYQESGFDALTFRSLKELIFSGSVDVQLNRSLVLDAPLISASGDEHINLRAPLITLANTRSKYGGESEDVSYRMLVGDEQELHVGSGSLCLSGEWIDVIGSLGLSGFGEVTLDAAGDMTLTDQPYYSLGSTVAWRGQLRTPGDLVVRGSRIYPTTLSDFTLKSDSGRITILPGGRQPDTPIVSAGGSLTVEAAEIDHQGYLAAPMGQLRLLLDSDTGAPASRIQLGPDSVTSVACNSSIAYGDVKDIFWNISEKPKELTRKSEVQPVLVEGLPERRLEIVGNQVIIQDGAVIDISGGGSVFSAEFLPGIAGLVDPFQTDGRYVVLPGHSQPGDSVYLTGGGGLPAGTYALLPEEYAFLPGAYVIEDLGALSGAGEIVVSEEGYPVVTGYAATMDTEFRSQVPHGYAVRTAQEVFEEGDFNARELVSGSPGSLEIRGTTTILDGEIKASALPGYEGGFAAIIGAQSAVVRASTSLPAGFSFDNPIPEGFVNQARIAAEGLSGLGVSELSIGTLDITKTVTFEQDTVLEAHALTVAGRDLITLEKGSEIHAVGPGGSVTLNSPDGMVTVGEGALIEVSDAMHIDSNRLALHGQIRAHHSSLNLIADKVFIVEDDYGEPGTDGVYLTESLKGFEGFTDVSLKAVTALTFKGDVNLTVGERLAVDSPRITGQTQVNVNAGKILLLNTGDGTADTEDSLVETGKLTLSCGDMTIGHGDMVLDGFADVSLIAEHDMTFTGKGSLLSSGDLHLAAACMTTSYYQDNKIDCEVAGFLVQAGDSDTGYRDVVIAQSGGAPGAAGIPGGSLDIRGRDIELSSVIDSHSGRVSLEAMGTAADGHGIRLTSGAAILAPGTDYAPGGRVSLWTEGGSIHLDTGSHIDVSAGGQGDAGRITLYAPTASVEMSGAIDGQADGGFGGTLRVDAGSLEDFSAVLALSAAGGFDEAMDIRARTGDMTLAQADSVHAHHVKLTADNGDIDVMGTIDASGKEGGLVELAAGHSLRVHESGSIEAKASPTGGSGGGVFLSVAENEISLAEGSVIDVSGAQPGQGGLVHLRTACTEFNDEIPMALAGTIRGASEVVAEGVKYYQDDVITTTDITTYRNDSDVFMGHAATIKDRLLSDITLDGLSTEGFHLVPGIEVRSAGDLVLATDWDLTSQRYEDEAGVLTLRAQGDLRLDRSLVDHPTPPTQLNDTLLALPNSWGLNLVAGADLGSADIMATHPGSGDFSIADGQLAYTENASIRFASGRDTNIGSPPGASMHKYMVNLKMAYSLATFNGDVDGNVGRDLTIDENGVIQSATGDIDITVGRDLHIGLDPFTGSAIRTTGAAPPNQLFGGLDWLYLETHDGGDIRLDVGGDIRVDQIMFYQYQNVSTPHLLYWDNMYSVAQGSDDLQWAADYGTFFAQEVTPTAGVATMGGGSVTVHTGGDLFCQIGIFKEGNLKVFANGNASGFFQVADGEGTVTAMGNIRSDDPDTYDTSLALFDAQVAVTAYGNMEFGTVFNPTFQATVSEYQQVTPLSYLDYGEESSVELTSVTGDLSLSGVFWKERILKDVAANDDKARRVLPPIVALTAEGDIHLGSDRGGDFLLAPSKVGNLQVAAGGTISGLYTDLAGNPKRATLRLSDLAPEDIYGRKMIKYDVLNELFADATREAAHGVTPIHLGDPMPSSVVASGDIRELRIISSEMTTVEAGGDITGLYFFGQNVHPTDVTAIRAAGNIQLSSVTAPPLRDTGYIMAGPGHFLVQAGHSVDLGITQGIQAVGNAFYSALSEEESSLAVVAGLYKEVGAAEMMAFFDDLKVNGQEYSRLLAEGDVDGAAKVAGETQEAVIAPLFQDGEQAGGDINMTSSSISTSAESSDIFIISAGDVNVGLTTLADPSEVGSSGEEVIGQETGLFTSQGGGIGVFSMGDLNVNESRIMTFRGGDIIVWSDQGDINAGRGSKTAINTGSPKVVAIKDEEGNVIAKKIEWEPPSVGSGIRTLTYDPDGFLGPLEAPAAGDAYLFAPQGIIDAGEAGISARNVILGATEVVNVQNIEVSGTSVGVPTGAESASSLGALAGAGSVTEAGNLTEETAGVASARERAVQEVADLEKAFSPSWMQVEFIGFEEEDDDKR